MRLRWWKRPCPACNQGDEGETWFRDKKFLIPLCHDWITECHCDLCGTKFKFVPWDYMGEV